MHRGFPRSIHDAPLAIDDENGTDMRHPRTPRCEQQLDRQAVERQAAAKIALQTLLDAEKQQIDAAEHLLGLLHDHSIDAQGLDPGMFKFMLPLLPEKKKGSKNDRHDGHHRQQDQAPLGGNVDSHVFAAMKKHC